MGIRLAPDVLVIINGAMEVLNLALQAITEPGDVVVLERLRLRAVEVASHPRTRVNLDSSSEVLRLHSVKACRLMPYFLNPFRSLVPVEAKQALVCLLTQHLVPLIEDDVYGELYFSHHRPRLAKAFDTEGLVLHCSSFSCSLVPGYRVSWAAAGRFAQTIQRMKLMASLATAVSK